MSSNPHSLPNLLRIGALALLAAVAATPARAADAARALHERMDKPSILVASSTRGNILRYGQRDGRLLGELAAGISHPDTMIIGPDGMLYVSSGTTPGDSAVLRFDPCTGAFAGTFAAGHGMHRPYGMAFGPDGRFYVASFLSDQILRFDAATGAFIDVFATGNATPGGLNGPNSLAFDANGALYVSTEGSVAVGGTPTFPGLPSQVLKFDVHTGTSTVFADQPPASPEGLGFVSLLGLAFGPDCRRGGHGDRQGRCDLFVSDFAGDVRRFNAQGQLVQTMSTNYTGTIPSGNFVGGLSFGTHDALFVAAFDNRLADNPGAILRYDGKTGAPWPAPGQYAPLFVPQSPALGRPIGILAVDNACKRSGRDAPR